MRDLEFYKNNAVNNGICSSATQEWAMARNKEELMKLVSKPYAILYFIHSLNEGWGLDSEYIAKEFGEYTKGDYLISNENDGTKFTSVVLNDVESKEFDYSVDVAMVLNCRTVSINVNNYSMQYHIANGSSDIVFKSDHKLATVFIHLHDNSSVDISGIEGNIIIYKYSDNVSIRGAENAKIKTRNIKKYM